MTIQLYIAVAVWAQIVSAELIIPHPVPLDACLSAAFGVIGDGAQGWCLPIPAPDTSGNGQVYLIAHDVASLPGIPNR